MTLSGGSPHGGIRPHILGGALLGTAGEGGYGQGGAGVGLSGKAVGGGGLLGGERGGQGGGGGPLVRGRTRCGCVAGGAAGVVCAQTGASAALDGGADVAQGRRDAVTRRVLAAGGRRGCRGSEVVLAGQEGVRVADGGHGQEVDGGRRRCLLGAGGERGQLRGLCGCLGLAVTTAEEGGSAREEGGALRVRLLGLEHARVQLGFVGHGS